MSLAIRGQGVWTRLPSFSQLEVLPAESGKQGSEPSLDACTHMNTTLCPSLPTHYAEKQQDTETSQASFLYQSSPPSLDWAFSVKNEPQSPGAFSVIYREPYLCMGFPAAANSKSQREEEGENHKWIER